MMTQDKVVVVAGVGPGNGTALARRFAAEERPVAMLSRDKAHADALAADVPGARGYACDVGDETSVRACFATIAAEMGEVDTLLFNAGNGVFADVEHVTAEQFEASWRVNALGSFLCSREVIPAMKAAGAGNIIFVGAITDTATVLQIRASLDVLAELLDRCIAAAKDLAGRHRALPMAGRSNLQQAVPITFGFKMARLLSALLRHHDRLAELRPPIEVLKFGGACGTLA